MRKRKYYSRYKWLFILFALVIIAPLLFLYQNSKASQSPNLSQDLTADWKTYTSSSYIFKYPSDWSKVGPRVYELSEDISFRSPDYQENLYPFITNGAELNIDKSANTNKESLKSYIVKRLPAPLEKNISKLEALTYGTTTYQHLLTCWEGCYDHYYLATETSFITISFACAPNCNSEEAIAKNKYSIIKDTFLENATFLQD